MDKIQRSMNWAVLAAELSHIFCCALPSLFSILSLMVGIGVLSTVPTFLVDLHDVMHDWEIPIILMSGSVILLGWSLFFVSRKMDCLSTGCGHEPCEPKKKRSHNILIIATALFVINVGMYTFFHYIPENAQAAAAHHNHDHDHDH